jgi:hypothetical protein
MSFHQILKAGLFLFLFSAPLWAGTPEVDRAKLIFLEAARECAAGIPDEHVIENLMWQLRTTFLSRADLKVVTTWGLTQPEIRLIAQAWNRVQIKEEKAAARGIDFSDRATFGIQMLEKEIGRLVNPATSDRILFIGSGPLPSAPPA